MKSPISDMHGEEDSTSHEAIGSEAVAAAVDSERCQMVSDEAAESTSRRESLGCEALARAISSTLGAVMSEFDSRAEGVYRSQDELCSAIDRLTGELDKLLEDAPLPFIMQHAAKISSIRRRVSSLNLLLKSIQRRIDNIDRMLSTGLPEEPPRESILSALQLPFDRMSSTFPSSKTCSRLPLLSKVSLSVLSALKRSSSHVK